MFLRCSMYRMANRWYYCVSRHQAFRVVFLIWCWGDGHLLLLERVDPSHPKELNNRALPIRAEWQHLHASWSQHYVIKFSKCKQRAELNYLLLFWVTNIEILTVLWRNTGSVSVGRKRASRSWSRLIKYLAWFCQHRPLPAWPRCHSASPHYQLTNKILWYHLSLNVCKIFVKCLRGSW